MPFVVRRVIPGFGIALKPGVISRRNTRRTIGMITWASIVASFADTESATAAKRKVRVSQTASRALGKKAIEIERLRMAPKIGWRCITHGLSTTVDLWVLPPDGLSCGHRSGGRRRLDNDHRHVVEWSLGTTVRPDNTVQAV